MRWLCRRSETTWAAPVNAASASPSDQSMQSKAGVAAVCFGRQDDRPSIVRHLHQFGRIQCLGAGLCDNQGNQLPDVAHLATRQQRHRGELKPLAGLGVGFNRWRQVVQSIRCHVRRGQDCQNPGRRSGLRNVNRANSRMRVRRPHKHGVRQIRKPQIVEISALADQKPRILAPFRRDPKPETVPIHGTGSVVRALRELHAEQIGAHQSREHL